MTGVRTKKVAESIVSGHNSESIVHCINGPVWCDILLYENVFNLKYETQKLRSALWSPLTQPGNWV